MNIFPLRLKFLLGLLLISFVLLGGALLAQASNPGYCDGFYGPDCAMPPIVIAVADVSASPQSILQGEGTTITWSCSEMNGVSFGPWGSAYYTASSNFFSPPKGYPYESASSSGGGSVVVYPSSNTTYTINCTISSTAGGSSFASDSVTVIVDEPTPDLYAGATGAVTGTINSPITFNSNVYNQGNGAATGFPNSFQISGIGYVAAQTHTLGVGGSAAISSSYTFSSPGSYSVRACADTNTGGAGTLSESNESNNCGAWATVTVNPPVPAPPAGLSASCNAAGTSVTFSWSPAIYATGYYFRNDDQQISSCGSWYCQSPPDVSTDPIAQTSYTINGIVPGHTNSWWVHSNNSMGYSDATWSSITCSGQADLTAGALAPTSAVTGTPVSFTGNVSNTGNGSAGAASNSALRIFNSSGGLVYIAGYNTGDVAAGGSSAVSYPYTFSVAGTYSTSLCADWEGAITESNEGNNCGPSTTVTVTTPAPICSNDLDDDGDGATDYPADTGCSSPDDTTDGPNPPTASLSAFPLIISAGDSSTLSWHSIGATSCSGEDSFTAGGPSGTRSVSPTKPGANNYTLTCAGPGGTSQPAFASITVITPTAYITAEPTLVNGSGAGGTVSLKWNAVESSVCSITSSQGGTIFSGAPAVGTTTTAATGITKQTRYTLTCTTLAEGTVSSSVLVNVRFDSDEF